MFAQKKVDYLLAAGKKACMLVLPLIFFWACKEPPQQSTRTYREDVSIYRPSFDAARRLEKLKRARKQSKQVEFFETDSLVAVENINRKLDSVNQQIVRTNQYILTADGYRIQVYSGNSAKRKNEIKRRIYQLYPNINVYTEYDKPTFKVMMGDFLTYYQAQNVLYDIEGKFTSAIIIEEKISLK